MNFSTNKFQCNEFEKENKDKPQVLNFTIGKITADNMGYTTS